MAKLTIHIGAALGGLKKGLSTAKAKIGSFCKNIRGGLNTAFGGIGSMLTVGGAATIFNSVIEKMDQIG